MLYNTYKVCLLNILNIFFRIYPTFLKSLFVFLVQDYEIQNFEIADCKENQFGAPFAETFSHVIKTVGVAALAVNPIFVT